MGKEKPVDWRKVRTGKDGRLYVRFGEQKMGTFIGACDTFRMWMSSENIDFQPVGSAVKFAIPTGHTVHVSLTETVINDELLISKVIDNLKGDKTPEFIFEGKLEENDLKSNKMQSQKIIIKECISDGEIDLLNITPGETVKRAWTFRANTDPSIIK